MRSLTIQREKNFAASAARIKVYAEDPTAPELTIGGTPCRFLGELKNGEEKTFQISEGETRVYVIAGKRSKDFCNDYYRVPMGNAPVRLSGKCQLDPIAGNAFLFNDNYDESALNNRKQNRKQSVRRYFISSVIVIAIFAAGMFLLKQLSAAKKNEPKEFSEQGIHITLTEAFSETQEAEYTASYLSKTSGVYVVRDEFSQAEGLEELSLREYAQYVPMANPQVTKDDGPFDGDGFLYYEYSSQDEETGLIYHYLVSLHKGPDAFWIVNFITLDNKYEELRPQFIQWAESVRFD